MRKRGNLAGKLLRGREEAGAPDLGSEIQARVFARLVRGTQMRILTGTGILEEAQTWLPVVERTDIPVNTLTSPTEKPLPCTAGPVLELVVSDVE